MNLYRVPRPSSCQNRLCAGFTVRFSHVSSCLLAPHPVYSFSVLFSPFNPSHYSVKTKSPLSLFPVLHSPLGPSLYSDKTKSPFHSFPILLSPLGPSHYYLKPNHHFTLFQYCFLHYVPPITPLKPNPPFYSFSVLLSPLGPSHYSVKTQILPFTLFQYGLGSQTFEELYHFKNFNYFRVPPVYKICPVIFLSHFFI